MSPLKEKTVAPDSPPNHGAFAEDLRITTSLWIRKLSEPPNLVLLTGFLTLCTVIVYVTTLPGFPRPAVPIRSLPDWASWYDAMISFPLLVALLLILVRPQDRTSAVFLLLVVAVMPAYLILASYSFSYNQHLGLVDPPLPILLILALPQAVALLFVVAAFGGPRIRMPTKTRRLESPPKALWGALSLVIALIGLEVAFRLWNGLPSNPYDWTSDVGWTLQDGGGLLFRGVNPYNHALQPYGGPAPLYYGPLAFAAVAPFTPLGIGIGAHISAGVYAAITIIGLRKTLGYLNPASRWNGVVLFLALPTSVFALESGTTLHILTAAAITWGIYFFVTKRTFLCGLTCVIGGLISILPAVLVIPYLFTPQPNGDRLKLLGGFVPGAAIATVGALILLPKKAVEWLMALTQGVGPPSQFTLTSYLIRFQQPLVIWPLMVVVVVGSVYLSRGPGQLAWRALSSAAWLLLMIPFASGYFLSFFFVWQCIPLFLILLLPPFVSNDPDHSSANGQRRLPHHSSPNRADASFNSPSTLTGP